MITVAGRQCIPFKVVALSDNRNSFGLRLHVLIAKNGMAYTACANTLNTKQEGDILNIPVDTRGIPQFAPFGFEIPARLPNAPDSVVKEVWG